MSEDKSSRVTLYVALASAAFMVAVGGWFIWTRPSGQQRATLRGHSGPVWSLAYSKDGSALASVGEDGQVIVWSPDGRKKSSWQGHKGAAFDHEGVSQVIGDLMGA